MSKMGWYATRSSKKRHLTAFANKVLTAEGFKDWHIKWHGTDICLQNTKTISIADKWYGYWCIENAKIHILHEIAHIRTYPVNPNQPHGVHYYQEWHHLIRRYLPDIAIYDYDKH